MSASDSRDQEPRLTHSDTNGFRMVDVAAKPITERTASAEASVRLNATASRLVQEHRNKKGDTLAIAQLAGIQAVKHTANLIPLCHPLPVDGVEVAVRLDGDHVRITAEVKTTGRTGVEMEALHAVSVAALTVIDMVKAVQRDASIEKVWLTHKTGGTRGDFRSNEASSKTSTKLACMGAQDAGWPDLVCCVLTVSDRASSGVYVDRGGPSVVDWLASHVPGVVTHQSLVTDDADSIEQQLRAWCDESGEACRLILTTGGTGTGPRDVTPEATIRVIERMHPGLTEHARRETAKSHPFSVLSRSVAGVRGRNLIVNLPGSPRGAVEWLDALEVLLPHTLETLRGEA